MNVKLSWRLFRFGIHTLKGLLICGLVFPFIDQQHRSKRIQYWSQQLLRMCGVHAECRQPLPDTHVTSTGLIVANHISWLDIFVLNSIQPCRFIAKEEVRHWPVVGWLVALAGTLFISRERKKDLKRVFRHILHHLQLGERVAFFPQGTSSAHDALTPFKASLFETAIIAHVDIHPYAIGYVDSSGAHQRAAEYIGETTFMQSVIRVLSSQDLIAQVQALPIIAVNQSNRRELAQAAHEAIAKALTA